MGKARRLWEKIEVPVIVVGILLFLFLLVSLNQKINFILGNELIVYLEPHEKSFSLNYGGKGSADFDVSISNFGYCKTTCEYSFNDRSNSIVLDKGEFGISRKEHVKKKYEVGVSRLGSGQEIYSFDIKCKNKKSIICLTDGVETYRSSLVTVNYDLTETEKGLKARLKEDITRFLGILKKTDEMHQSVSEKYFEAGFKVNLKGLSSQKIDANGRIDRLRIEAENLRTIWAGEDYNKLNMTFNGGFFGEATDIAAAISWINKSIEDLTDVHNSLLYNLSAMYNDLKNLETISGFNDDVFMVQNAIYLAEQFNGISSALTNNTFESYDTLVDSIEELSTKKGISANAIYNDSMNLFFVLNYQIKKENDFLCLLGKCNSKIALKDAILAAESFSLSYPDSGPIKNSCEELKGLDDIFSNLRNETWVYITQNNVTIPKSSQFFSGVNSFVNSKNIEINNSVAGEYSNLNLQDFSESAVNAMSKNIPKIIKSIPLANFSNETGLFVLSNISYSEESKELIRLCNKIGFGSKLGNFDFAPVVLRNNYSAVSSIETSLPDNKPVCCLFSECKACCNDETCTNDPATYPVILLHGHSFVKDNSPEFSLDAFNLIQSKLQEDGYLNAGIVSLYSKNEPSVPGTWGLSGKPVSVKASYYFDAFKKDDKYIVVPTKSENIDTYAVRLKDLIAIVKERTGKPKVNIIAHSMGGLVARRYVQIFGEDDIDKIILVAAPNKGIVGSVSDFCGIIGENRECIDMQENSVFLRKLNDISKQPQKAKIYNIVGQGCAMKFGDGDGVVLVRNAKLENSEEFFMDGTCPSTFGSYFHTEILNIEKYPEIYGMIKEILQNQELNR